VAAKAAKTAISIRRKAAHGVKRAAIGIAKATENKASGRGAADAATCRYRRLYVSICGGGNGRREGSIGG